MAVKGSDRYSYGIAILIFGVLFFLDKLGALDSIPYASKLVSVGSFFFIGGVVFIATQPKKILGWIFAGIGVLLNADLFFGWMQDYSRYLLPIALVIAGAAMILSSKKR